MPGSSALRGREVLEAVFRARGPEARYVCANGYVSREAYAVQDWPQSFYMIGSMGLAAPIGLGVALARPEREVVVLDGDGNVLMGLGALALVASQRPPSFLHVCLDNGVYASTGNQPTLSAGLSLEGLARAAGYAHASSVEDLPSLEEALAAYEPGSGPTFLRARIAPEPHPRSFARVSHSPREIRDRFRQTLAETL